MAKLPDPALEARDVSRRYKSSGRGVEGVSFSVAPGEVFGLVGPNGSGKSTLLRVLSTAIEPDGGTFSVAGADGSREKRKVRAKMGLMVDRPTHYGDLTGRENAYFFARAYGVGEAKAEAVVSELLDFFDLAEYADDRVKTYSYGMGKKLALVEALAHRPDVLLLDEPSLGLDYTSQLAFQRKIRDLSGAGVAVVLASNQVDYGPVERVDGVGRVVPEGRNLVVHCGERPGIVADVVAGLVESGGDIVSLSVERPNLEDVFVKLTGEALRRED